MRTLQLQLTILLLFVSTLLLAQGGLKYQAVVRDATGTLVPNTAVTIQISIIEDSAAGTAVYIENHPVTTNQFGLVNLSIGNGDSISGSTAAIDLPNHSYFIGVGIDLAGGTTFTNMGTSEIGFAPYAAYSEMAGSAPGTWTENGADIYYNTGNVGIGTTTPTNSLSVVGKADFSEGIIVGPTTAAGFSADISFKSGVGNGLKLQNAGNANYWHMYVWSSGDLSFYFNAAQVASINQTTGVYSALSDARLKKDIRDFSKGILAKVDQLEPKTYKFKSDEEGKDYIGFLAQDVQKVFPQLVNYRPAIDGEKEDLYTMDYAGFGTISVAAIKELNQKVDAQQQQIELLITEIAALKANR